MNPTRAHSLNKKPVNDGPIIYWMNRDCRVKDNWALVHAMELAEQKNTHVVVVYNLVVNFLGGGARQWNFKIGGLRDVADEYLAHNIPFHLITDERGDSAQKVIDFCIEHKAGAIVTDFFPLNISFDWNMYVAEKAPCAVICVDAHNIVPAWVASQKQEFGAYTLRPKLHKLLPTYMDEFPKIKKQSESLKPGPQIDWDDLLKNSAVPATPAPVDWISPGAKEANAHLKNFLKNKFADYAEKRNDPNEDAQSGLSPYLHYGHISAQRIALEVLRHIGEKNIADVIDARKNGSEKETASSASTFLEELIVRRELADNFCFYNRNYDNPKCFPEWAQKSWKKFGGDKREYIYSLEQFEQAETHDALWNAAQLQMVSTGKMHGYMRMYWAKKILEWTPDAETAMRTAIFLNDKYELDGRDPNGYAGIAWSIGGVHDRAWFARPIFGQVRYMNESGCKKKFDVKKYVATHSKNLKSHP